MTLRWPFLTARRRRDYVCECLKKYFYDTVYFKKPSGGLAIWITFQPSISLLQLAEEASKLDLFLPKTILYQDKKTCAIRLGFGHLNEEEIEIVISKLQLAYTVITTPKIKKAPRW